MGERVRQLRGEQGLTVADMARYLGVDAGWLSRIENGRRQVRIDTVERLAEILAVDVSDLLCFPQVHIKHRIQDLMRRAPVTVLVEIERMLVEALGEEAGQDQKAKRRAPRKG
jgi:transcriptional regulator with XRE-family HTH domain